MPWTALRRAAVFAAVLAAGYVAYWYYGTTLVRGSVENWIASARADGIEAGHDGIEVGGFPLAYRVEIARPAIAGTRPGAQWDWTSERATADFGPFDFRTLRLSFEGEQSLNFLGDDGRRISLRTPGPTLVGLIVASDRLPDRVTIDARALDITGPPEIAGLRIERANLDAHRRRGGAASEGLDLAFTLEAITLPPRIDALFGPIVERLSADLDIVGLIQEAPPREAAAAWRDKGGKLDIRSFLIVWGPLDMTAKGTLVLDGNLQPAGTLDVGVTGYGAFLEALVARGQMDAEGAGRLKALLDLLAKPQKNGGPPKLRAPLTLRKGKLLLGPIVLMTLPRIDWPE